MGVVLEYAPFRRVDRHPANLLNRGGFLRGGKEGFQIRGVIREPVRRGSKRAVGENHSLEQGVGREPVGAVEARARRLAAREQAVEGGLAVEVGANAAAQVVRRRHNRDPVRGHVQPAFLQLGGDAREVLEDIVRRQVADVQVHAPRLDPSLRRGLDLAVDGPRHHVARGELEPLIVPRHEPLARVVKQPAAVASHRLGDEKRVLVRLFLFSRAPGARVQRRRVELVKFHVGDVRARPHRHRDAVPGAHARVRGAGEELTGAAGREEGATRQERHHGAVAPADNLGADAPPASAVWILLRDEQVARRVVLVKGDVRVSPGALEQRALDLLAGHVRRVHDAVLGVPALPRQVQRTARPPRKLASKRDELVNRVFPLGAHHVHRRLVAEEIARDLRVPRVLLRGVVRIDHRRDAALGVVCAPLVRHILGHHRDFAVLRSLQRVGEAGDAAADDEEVDANGGFAVVFAGGFGHRDAGRVLDDRDGRHRGATTRARPVDDASPGGGVSTKRGCSARRARRGGTPDRDASPGTRRGRATRHRHDRHGVRHRVHSGSIPNDTP